MVRPIFPLYVHSHHGLSIRIATLSMEINLFCNSGSKGEPLRKTVHSSSIFTADILCTRSGLPHNVLYSLVIGDSKKVKEVLSSLYSSFPNSSNVWPPSELKIVLQVNLLGHGTSSQALVTHCKHTTYSSIQERTYHQTHMHSGDDSSKTSPSVHMYQNRYMWGFWVSLIRPSTPNITPSDIASSLYVKLKSFTTIDFM